jgi:nitrite reductase/ring-hydroxylating ferredoxin subunit
MALERELRAADIDQLLDDMSTALEDGLIPARIFNDHDVHRCELDRVFSRSWLFVGHESEVPSPGDYCLRYLGLDPFVFVRGEDGQIRLLYDACRHRGTQICRAECGNASHFRCSYHGWTYKNTGELVGAPAFRDAYGGLDKSEWGLIQAPQLASVHGFVFACLDADAPSFDDYLGDMRWYLDLVWGLSDEGLEVIGEPQRYVIDANWKSGAENFAGDDYHTLFLHKSMYDIGAIQIPPRSNMYGYHVQAGNGHTMSFSIAPDADEPGPQFWGYPEEVVATFREANVGPEKFALARRSRVGIGTVFPNFSWLVVPQTDDARGGYPHTINLVRLWQPIGPDKTECWIWYLAWKGIPDELKERSYRAGIGTVSSSGIFEQDDIDPWQSIARTGRSDFARRIELKLNYQMGLPGIGTARPATDWAGPGLAYWPRYEEGIQRALFRRWLEFMTRGPYPECTPPSDGSSRNRGGANGR